MRVGFGFDFHRLVEGRDLILGGVKIPWSQGLLGHSDGDVLLHAVGDAILGAAGENDIGTHFPDTDPQYKGISSLVLLEKIMSLTKAKARIVNVDSVIVCEAPKLAPYVAAMRAKIADVLSISSEDVAIKSKTCEGVGIIGKGEGIVAYAVVLIK